MKKITIVFSFIIISAILIAQTPQAFKYQAVIRDNAGDVITNQNVSLLLSIVKTSETGTVLYSESHSATTNGFGLVNLEIGNGTLVSGSFQSILWGDGSQLGNQFPWARS